MNSIVVNIRKKELNKRGIKDFEEWQSGASNRIYIGRNMCAYVPGTNKSKWANPYSTKGGNYSLTQSLELYEAHIRNSNLINELAELDNAELGCWCAPNPCHGNILIKLRLESLKN